METRYADFLGLKMAVTQECDQDQKGVQSAPKEWLSW